MKPKVTVCIPAYQAENFIDRTLNCARSQTYPHLQIVVSVDRCDDRTVDICRRHQKDDHRIELVTHKKRLGWSQNANAALDRVEGDFFFLYFHDDIIKPGYVETLLRALNETPGAATVHCDLVEFGLVNQIRQAHAFTGPAMTRLVEFLTSPQKGTTLRSLTRTGAGFETMRFPKITGDNAWSAYPYHLRQLASGPATTVHEPLYKRWQRPGSLTRDKNWLPKNITHLLEAQRQSASVCLGIIDAAARTESERQVGRYCLYLFMLLFTRKTELRLGVDCLADGKEISPVFADQRIPKHSDSLTADQQSWVRQMETDLLALESKITKSQSDNAVMQAQTGTASEPANS